MTATTARLARLAPFAALALLAACDDVDGGRFQEFEADLDLTVSERAQADFDSYPAVVMAALVIESESERALEMGHVALAVLEEPGQAATFSADLYAALGPCIERDVRAIAWLASLDEASEPGEIVWAYPISEAANTDAIAFDAECGPRDAGALALSID